MPYFSYHNTAKKLIREGKLVSCFFTENWRGIRPALVLVFRDDIHPVMPIRQNRWKEYLSYLPKEKISPL